MCRERRICSARTERPLGTSNFDAENTEMMGVHRAELAQTCSSRFVKTLNTTVDLANTVSIRGWRVQF